MLNAPWVHLVVASWFVIAAFAQTNTSSIAGVVSDASGSVIPNATITVTQAESGFERQTASSTSGDFVLPPNLDSSSPFFGQIQGAQPPRILQFSLRLQF